MEFVGDPASLAHSNTLVFCHQRGRGIKEFITGIIIQGIITGNRIGPLGKSTLNATAFSFISENVGQPLKGNVPRITIHSNISFQAYSFHASCCSVSLFTEKLERKYQSARQTGVCNQSSPAIHVISYYVPAYCIEAKCILMD